MDEDTLPFLPLEELAPLLAREKISPVDLVEATLRRMERLNAHLNAYITVTAEHARVAARKAERAIRAGRCRGPLHGVPISLKDNIWTSGIRTTAGSKILADFLPGENATVAERLERAGAILLGKTNLHEFAYGVSTENPHYGATHNPWNTNCIPGGSSGGSAAAIAAGMGCASVGSDTGGSIRIPAALCGVVGLKPTFGRVSCYGVVPLSRSLDHVGPLASSVAAVAFLLRVMAGRDALDPLTSAEPVADYTKAWQIGAKLHPTRKPLRGTRLGWPREFFFDAVDEEIRRAIEAAAAQFERLGATIEEISLPHLRESIDSGDQIAVAEATSYHQQMGYFPARAGDYGEDVRKRLEAGLEARAVDYLQAIEMQRRAQIECAAIFERIDALLAPTTPIAAPAIGQKTITIGGHEAPVRSTLLRLNRPGNFLGMPAISVPCGFTRHGLPIGLQLLADKWKESTLLRIAYAYEQATEWHRRHPKL